MATLQSESLSCVILQKITFWLVYLGVAKNQRTVPRGLTGCKGWPEGMWGDNKTTLTKKKKAWRRVERGGGPRCHILPKSKQVPAVCPWVHLRDRDEGGRGGSRRQKENTVWKTRQKEGRRSGNQKEKMGRVSAWDGVVSRGWLTCGAADRTC